MNDLIYTIRVPKTSSKDVVTRFLSIHVNGVLRHRKNYPSLTENFGEFAFKNEDEVVVSITDIDDANNQSFPLTVTFIAKDTIVPDTPSNIDISLIREDFDEPNIS